MRYLRASTQADIVIGPVWSTSDYTYKADLAYNAAGIDCNVNKNGAAKTDVTLANSAGDGYFRADVNGFYLLTLSTSLTDTVGRFRVSLQATGYAMAPHDYTVLSGAVYDAMFGTAALSTLTAASVWTEAVSGYTDNTKFGGLVNDVDAEVDTVHGLVQNIATTGATAYDAASSFTKTTGGTETNTYASTDTANSVYHQIADSGGTLDCYYQYTLRPDEVAVGVTFKGRATGSNDPLSLQAYDWVNSAWVTIASLAGTAGTTDTTVSPSLVSKYTGTGANVGKVRVRLYGTGLTTAVAYVDQCIVAKASTSRTVGYSQGAIWIDSSNGTAGTTPYFNGTADHPVTTWADALTLAASLNIYRFQVAPATQITLAAAAKKYSFAGKGYKLALGGQDISYTVVDGCELVTGIGPAADWESFFWNCQMGAVTLGESDLHNCHVTDTVTLSAAAPYLFNACVGVPIGTPGVDFGSAVGSSAVVMGGCKGQWTISNMKTGDTLICDGNMDLTLAASCTGGTVYISGAVRLTNSGSGQTIHDTSRYGEEQNVQAVTTPDANVALIKAKTDLIPAAPAAVGDIPTAATISDAVWDEATSGHAATGSTGKALTAPPTAATIADSVWDETLTQHLTAGSMGFKLSDTNLAVNSADAHAHAIDTRLPSDPADASDLAAAIAGLPTDADVQAAATAALAAYDAATGGDITALDALLDLIKAKTDLITPNGTGSVAWDYTLTEADTTPIAGADVWVTTDEAGTNVVASGLTDEFGVVHFYLDPGDYFIWAAKAGWNFTNPDEETVAAPEG